MVASAKRLANAWLGLLGSLIVASCGGSGDGGGSAVVACTVDVQRQAILDIMTEWYFFNDEPEQQQKYIGLDLNDFATPEDLLEFLRYRPQEFDRNFTFQTTTAADQQFFAAGQFIGFGFGSKFVDAPANTDLRLTQVFAGSPADTAGFRRGFRLLEIGGRTIAEINQAEGLSAALGPAETGVTLTFRVRDLTGAEFEATISKALITIDPIPFSTVFDVGGTQVGYLDMRTFVTTAEDELGQIFVGFETQGVTALIVDLRYNGGGVVETAELLADLIGGFIASGQVASETRHNSAKTALNTTDIFQQQTGSLTLLQQIVFITTASSASASELIINAMRPHTVVTLVGDDTFGKPVGQSGFGYCDNERLLRPVTFEVVNALGEGRFFAGLPVDCSAADDLTMDVGDPSEESLASALTVIETGSCPAPGGMLKLIPVDRHTDVVVPPGAPAAQRFLRAF